ncbi:putative copper resistance protein [Escherichia coli]|uniref:Putative copper resistance protein n=1 Tax=Escherichia coli TaxID=562 RepID=A0A376LML8_ECOLX|nr:putative copper resistance protein [Escherichia coli]
MLAFTWIALRFIHFTSLMLVFGFAMYGAWLAPLTIRRLLTKRFLRLQQHAAVWSLISTTAMLAVQGGLMGTGWSDVFSPNIWQAVLQTQFGGVWLWQIVLALRNVDRRPYATAEYATFAVYAHYRAIFSAGGSRACDAE